MTFDADVQQSDDNAMVIKFWSDKMDDPIYTCSYVSLLDWISKAQDHEVIKGVWKKEVHKFYMNFSNQIEIFGSNYEGVGINSMTIEIKGGNKFVDSDGNDIDIAKGEYDLIYEKL